MEFKYDIALSFAGEDRKYVEEVAKLLESNEIKVFYDKFEQIDLWGKDLGMHFDYVYRKSARFCIPFISENYKKKIWTNYEIRNAISRAIETNEEYILPVRFDDTEIEGIRPTLSYLDLRNLTPKELAEMVIAKLNKDESKPVAEKEQVNEGRIYLSCNLVTSSFGLGSFGSVALGVDITNILMEYRYFNSPYFRITPSNDKENPLSFYMLEQIKAQKFPVKLEFGQVADVVYELKRGATEIWKDLPSDSTLQAIVTTTVGERYFSNKVKLSEIKKAFDMINGI